VTSVKKPTNTAWYPAQNNKQRKEYTPTMGEGRKKKEKKKMFT
jgi:hypothetical protein